MIRDSVRIARKACRDFWESHRASKYLVPFVIGLELIARFSKERSH